MAEWLYEDGIGERRAVLVEGGTIVGAEIELDDGALRVGEVVEARLKDQGPPAIVVCTEGREAVLSPVPPLSIGRDLAVEIVRESIPEPGRAKRAKAVPTDRLQTSAPDLQTRLAETGVPVRPVAAHEEDAFEAAGWSELLDEAITGEITFPGGALRMSPTPAMTLFDVDGGGDPLALALAGAGAITSAIRRHRIGGSIGIDFPTLGGKAGRQAVAAVIDSNLPPPFERTAVNGFGFLQIIRARPRASLPELLRADPVAAAARAALRTLERVPPGASNRHRLDPVIRKRLDDQPAWLAELVRRTGRVPILDG